MLPIQLVLSIVLISISVFGSVFRGISLGIHEIIWSMVWLLVIQIGWLWGIGDYFGFSLLLDGSGQDMFAFPSWLGLIVIIVGTLISFYLQYWLAKLLDRYISKRKMSGIL